MSDHLAALRHKLDKWTSSPASLNIVAEEVFALRALVSKKRDDIFDAICKPTAGVLVIDRCSRRSSCFLAWDVRSGLIQADAGWQILNVLRYPSAGYSFSW